MIELERSLLEGALSFENLDNLGMISLSGKADWALSVLGLCIGIGSVFKQEIHKFDVSVHRRLH